MEDSHEGCSQCHSSSMHLLRGSRLARYDDSVVTAPATIVVISAPTLGALSSVAQFTLAVAKVLGISPVLLVSVLCRIVCWASWRVRLHNAA